MSWATNRRILDENAKAPINTPVMQQQNPMLNPTRMMTPQGQVLPDENQKRSSRTASRRAAPTMNRRLTPKGFSHMSHTTERDGDHICACIRMYYILYSYIFILYGMHVSICMSLLTVDIIYLTCHQTTISTFDLCWYSVSLVKIAL